MSHDSCCINLMRNMESVTENENKTPKKRTVNPIEPTGEQVAENIRRLRGGMTYKELSQKLEDVGRPITVLGLRRIEACERKVDVDDLMAFAIVFNVSPLTLLMPRYATASITAHITGYEECVGTNVIWLWGLCMEPLTVPEDPLGERSYENRRAIVMFRNRSHPTLEPRQGKGKGAENQLALPGFEEDLRGQQILRYNNAEVVDEQENSW